MIENNETQKPKREGFLDGGTYFTIQEQPGIQVRGRVVDENEFLVLSDDETQGYIEIPRDVVMKMYPLFIRYANMGKIRLGLCKMHEAKQLVSGSLWITRDWRIVKYLYCDCPVEGEPGHSTFYFSNIYNCLCPEIRNIIAVTLAGRIKEGESSPGDIISQLPDYGKDESVPIDEVLL